MNNLRIISRFVLIALFALIADTAKAESHYAPAPYSDTWNSRAFAQDLVDGSAACIEGAADGLFSAYLRYMETGTDFLTGTVDTVVQAGSDWWNQPKTDGPNHVRISIVTALADAVFLGGTISKTSFELSTGKTSFRKLLLASGDRIKAYVSSQYKEFNRLDGPGQSGFLCNWIGTVTPDVVLTILGIEALRAKPVATVIGEGGFGVPEAHQGILMAERAETLRVEAAIASRQPHAADGMLALEKGLNNAPRAALADELNAVPAAEQQLTAQVQAQIEAAKVAGSNPLPDGDFLLKEMRLAPEGTAPVPAAVATEIPKPVPADVAVAEVSTPVPAAVVAELPKPVPADVAVAEIPTPAGVAAAEVSTPGPSTAAPELSTPVSTAAATEIPTPAPFGALAEVSAVFPDGTPCVRLALTDGADVFVAHSVEVSASGPTAAFSVESLILNARAFGARTLDLPGQAGNLPKMVSRARVHFADSGAAEEFRAALGFLEEVAQ